MSTSNTQRARRRFGENEVHQASSIWLLLLLCDEPLRLPPLCAISERLELARARLGPRRVRLQAALVLVDLRLAPALDGLHEA